MILFGHAVNDTEYWMFSSYVTVFQLMKETFPRAFGGQDGPRIFMTDNSTAQKNALYSLWPGSRLLLCRSHVPQAVWRWLWSSQHIAMDDRKRLMKLFQSVSIAAIHNTCYVQRLFCPNYTEDRFLITTD